MRIKSLSVENLRSIEIMDFQGSGGNLELRGGNGAGKSTIIDAVFLAVLGKKSLKGRGRGQSYALQNIVKEGADRASVQLVLDDPAKARELKIERSLKKKTGGKLTDTLRITAGDGGAVTQKDLDGLLSVLTSDPLVFASMPPKEQAEALFELVGPELSELEKKEAEHEASREALDRELYTLRAAVKTVPPEAEPPSTEARDKALAAVTDAEKNKVAEAALQASLETLRSRRDRVASQIENLKEEYEQIVSRGKKEKKELDALLLSASPVEGDPAVILADYEKAAAAAQAWTSYQEAAGRIENLAEKRKEAVLSRDGAREKKGQLLGKINTPFELGWSKTDGLSVGGRPLQELSTAEKIYTSSHLAAALSRKEGNIDVIFVRGGSLLDEETLGAVRRSAEELGMQLVVEIVDSKIKEIKITEETK